MHHRIHTADAGQCLPLPHAVADERLLLGMMLAMPATVAMARAIVWPSDMYVAAHQAAYAEIVRRHDAGEPVTLDAVIAAIGHTVRVDEDDIDVEATCHRIRDAAILREHATAEGVRHWQMGGGR